MKYLLSKRVSFVGKSLLWSVLFYMIFMAVINWDEIGGGRRMNNDAPEIAHRNQLLKCPTLTSTAKTLPVHIQSGNLLSDYTSVIESVGAIVYKLIGIANTLGK